MVSAIAATLTPIMNRSSFSIPYSIHKKAPPAIKTIATIASIDSEIPSKKTMLF